MFYCNILTFILIVLVFFDIHKNEIQLLADVARDDVKGYLEKLEKVKISLTLSTLFCKIYLTY